MDGDEFTKIEEHYYDTSYGKIFYEKETKFDVFQKRSIELWRCNAEVSWDVPKIAELHQDAYEDDIPYENVFQYYNNISLISQETDIIDILNDIRYLISKLRLLAFDIETDMKTGKIIAITCKSKDGIVIIKGVEKDILYRFKDVLSYVDVLFGWYSSIFDIPVLLNRCEHYKDDEQINQLKDMFVKRKVHFGITEWAFDLKNGVHIDFFFPISRKIITKASFTDNKLDSVVKELFDFNHYLKNQQTNLQQLDDDTFDKYCELDGKATWLFSGYLPFLMLTSVLSGISMSRIGLIGSSLISDGFYIKQLRRKYGNILIPKLRNSGALDVKGAEVFKSVSGVSRNVSCLDFKSQYPNIVKIYNISPENVNCGHKDCPVYHVLNRQTQEQKKMGIKTYTDIQMCIQQKGVLVEVVETCMEISDIIKAEREKNKNDKALSKFYKDVYDAFKAIRNNISYGYNLSPISRFGHPLCGKLIPYLGSVTILKARDICIKHLGESKIIYGDTDSLFVMDLTDDIVKEIEVATGIEVDIEGKGTIIMSGVKKKYILLTHDKKSKVRGIRFRRKDTPRFISEFQQYSVKVLEKAKDYDDVLKRMNRLIKDAKFLVNIITSLPIDRFVISKGVSSTANTPQYRAFQELDTSGDDFDRYDKIKYVYVERWLQLKTKLKRTFDSRAFVLFDYERDKIHFDKYKELFVKSLSDIFGRKFKLKKEVKEKINENNEEINVKV
jgi:DNA polymerase elongation subunit (family B)